MAYAALLSVSQTLEEILGSDPYFFPCSKERIESFQETVASLIDFLDNCPPICPQTVNDLITQIRDSAYEAEDAFESLVATHFLQKYGIDSDEKLKILPQRLEKVVEDIESIKKEVDKIHRDEKFEKQLSTIIESEYPYRGLQLVSEHLDQILDFDPCLFPGLKEKFESFQETIFSLMVFLACPPIRTQTVSNLITQISDSLEEEAGVFFEAVFQLRDVALTVGKSDVYHEIKIRPQRLEKVMEEIESIEKEVKKIHHDGDGVYEQRLLTLANSSMAYVALVSVSKTLEQILDFDPYSFPCIKEKVVSLLETLASLMDFSFKYKGLFTQQINNLMIRIRDSASEAEDVFESLLATSLPQNRGSDSYKKFKVCSQSLEKVMEDIESIEKKVKKIHLEGKVVHEQRILALASSSRPTSSGNNTDMVALDSDLEMQLKEQLVGGRSKIDVIPIVGIGGIGKTTLARILCDSQLIKETFDFRGWGTISQTYNVQEIVLGILKDTGVPLDGKEYGEQHLYQSLCGRKYLIVLDDVWDTQAWDDIKRLFPDNNNGSRIILTTRHSEVAAYANSFSTYHEMQPLNEDSSWSLLCQEIFLQKICPSDLVEIGKQIARKCQGLPLAISAIGGHLKTEKQTKEYWKYVSEKVSSVLRTADDPSLEILTLSYNYLPHHLKACFLYFGSFTEDRPVDVSRIVKLWVAEGFIKPCRSNSMEEVAEEYLRDVIGRNLVFVYEYGSFGEPKTCGIHDLFREICIREAKNEQLLFIIDRSIPCDLMELNSQRRLILSPNVTEDDEFPSGSIVSGCGTCSTTRSLICTSGRTSSTIKLVSGLLKVLNIIWNEHVKFPKEVLKLVNLKYLELGRVFNIPSSISRFRNLQTFIASPIFENIVPSEIWELPQLRHLILGGFYLPDIPDVQGKGTNAFVCKSLQTLSQIINFRCTQELAARMPNLKTLHLQYRINVVGCSFHSMYNLDYLRKLESLRCEFKFVPNDNILRNLAFPFSLKNLVLIGSRIPWEQMTIIGRLPNLEVLKLKYSAMKGRLWETNDGEFKQLEFLVIKASSLVEWKTEKDHFPRLRCIILQRCNALSAIPSEIGEIPTLEKIVLDDCSPEAESSAEKMLEEDNDIELDIVNSYAHSSPGSNDDLCSNADSSDDDSLHDSVSNEAIAEDLCDPMQSSSIN